MKVRTAFLLFLALSLTSTVALASNNPIPFIDQPLLPGAAAPGGSGFTLTVTGTGFVSTSAVQWNGAALVTTFVSSTKLTASVPAANIATAGTAIVTVFSPAPVGGTSNAVFFPISTQTTSVAYSLLAGYPSGGASNPNRQYVTADFNGDGKLDVATLNGDGTVSVLLGHGDGTFAPPAVLQPDFVTALSLSGTVTVTPIGITTGDFNDDGKLDIAVYNLASGSVSGAGSMITVFAGFGDGTFGNPIDSISGPASAPVSNFLVATDIDGDGYCDLLTPSADGLGGVSVWAGKAGGFFLPPAVQIPTPATGITGEAGPILSDFNGDGIPDLALAYGTSTGNQVVALALGNGDGTFKPLTTIESNSSFAGNNNVGLAAADFDEDGTQDIALYYEVCTSASGPCSGSVDLLTGVGNGTFVLPPLTTSSLPAGNPNLIVADLNEDSHSDLFVLNTPLIGRGDGTFIVNSVTAPNSAAAVGDFNNDGMLDVISMDPAGVIVDLRTTPDFTGYEQPTSQTVIAGANTSYQIFLAPLYGSENDVALSVSGVPSGATSFFTPVATVPRGNGSTQLQVNTTSSVTPGTYNLTLTAMATNGVSHTATLGLTVNPPTADFTGDISPGSTLIAAGETASYMISGQGINGFTGDITLSASGYPPGSVVTFNPAVITGGTGSSMLSITPPANAANGTYEIIITGTSGSLSHSGGRILQVNNTADFGGYLAPWSNAVVVGQRVSYVANITSTNGYTGATTLSVSGLPAGATYRITPSTIIGGAGTASLLIQTSSSTPLGVFMPTITAQSGSDIKSHPFELDVNPPGDFTGSISFDQTVATGSSGTYTVTLSPTGGFTADVTINVTGANNTQLPPGATISYSPSNIIHGGSGSITVTVTTASNTPFGTYAILFAGTAGGIYHAGQRNLFVTSPGDFGGTISDSQTISAGSSAVFTVSLAATGGFNSDVTLSVSTFGGSQLPPGSTITFSPSNVFPGATGTVNVTIATSPGTPAGSYNILFSATGGNIYHAGGRTLTVTP